MGNAACIGHRYTNEINPFLLDHMFAVPDRIEDFANGNGDARILSNEFQSALIIGRRGVF